MSYRAILLMVATLVLLLDIVLAAVIYRHYISPSYSKNLQARMREAFSQVAADPTGSQTALLRENFHVLVLRENGQLVTANVEPRQEDLENLRRTVDRAVVQPVFQTTGSDTEGELSLLGRSGGYYIEVSTQLDPIFSVAMTFTRYSIATGVIVWFATLLLVVAIERQLFQPIGEAVQVAKRIARQDFSQKCGTGGIARQSRALAESLNEMSDQLQSALSQLRQANAQLQDDIRAIERSESAMKHLIGNLSHDLKTPLALISGYAEGLSAGMAKTPDQQQEYCGIILDETERMRQIITRMLQLSQLESGQVQLELERFDIARLLENTLNQFSMEMEKAGVALERESPVPAMDGDGLYRLRSGPDEPDPERRLSHDAALQDASAGILPRRPSAGAGAAGAGGGGSRAGGEEVLSCPPGRRGLDLPAQPRPAGGSGRSGRCRRAGRSRRPGHAPGHPHRGLQFKRAHRPGADSPSV